MNFTLLLDEFRTLTSCLAELLFLGWAGFFFESPFFRAVFLVGVTIVTIGTKVLSTIIPVHPVSGSTFTGFPFNLPTPIGLNIVDLVTASSIVYRPIVAGHSLGTAQLRVCQN